VKHDRDERPRRGLPPGLPALSIRIADAGDARRIKRAAPAIILNLIVTVGGFAWAAGVFRTRAEPAPMTSHASVGNGSLIVRAWSSSSSCEPMSLSLRGEGVAIAFGAHTASTEAQREVGCSVRLPVAPPDVHHMVALRRVVLEGAASLSADGQGRASVAVAVAGKTHAIEQVHKETGVLETVLELDAADGSRVGRCGRPLVVDVTTALRVFGAGGARGESLLAADELTLEIEARPCT
jgi:hypothetical protein